MDSATYDSVGSNIIAVRGGRVFRCSPTDGSIISQSDYSQVAFGKACCVYDSGVGKVFASAWNTPDFSSANFNSKRSFFRINPASLSVEVIYDFDTVFSPGANNNAYLERGIATMRNVGGTIYCCAWGGNLSPAKSVLRFSAANPNTNTFQQATTEGFPSLAYGSVGGHDIVFLADQSGDQIFSWDFTASTSNTSTFDSTKTYLAIEYAPVQGNLYVTDEFEFIYRYDTSLNFIATIDTGFAGFNGIDIQLNPNDGLLYIAGGAYKDPVTQTNVVIVLNPATNLFTVKTGFDLPVGFVFVDNAHGGTKFAVQQGSVGLKQIV